MNVNVVIVHFAVNVAWMGDFEIVFRSKLRGLVVSMLDCGIEGSRF